MMMPGPSCRAPFGAAGTSSGDNRAAHQPVGARATFVVTYAGPELLAGEHRLEGFDCGSGTLNDWLVQWALRNQSSGTSRTWVVVEVETGQVVAFYASSTASILRSSGPKKMGRDQPEEMPAILLARMGVDSRHQAKVLVRPS
jgi:hypothetical protein